ncbi:hypothetical protein GCM10010331_64670 [Streptomyces xanthochromogenes]|nr:hypothetical protein GCM10010331_64670 [Streptomyces xanthochromogenes]
MGARTTNTAACRAARRSRSDKDAVSLGRGPLMPHRRLQARATRRTPEAPYRSGSCQVDQHGECAHSVPQTAPGGIPVIYEACTCLCHTPPDRDVPAEGSA